MEYFTLKSFVIHIQSNITHMRCVVKTSPSILCCCFYAGTALDEKINDKIESISACVMKGGQSVFVYCVYIMSWPDETLNEIEIA